MREPIMSATGAYERANKERDWKLWRANERANKKHGWNL